MNRQEREDWEALCEEEKTRRLLIKHEMQAEHHRHVRNWLIFICVALVIAFGVLYQNLYQKWQEEREFRIVAQAFSDYYEQDSEHYRQLYNDCLTQEEIEKYPWRK